MDRHDDANRRQARAGAQLLAECLARTWAGTTDPEAFAAMVRARYAAVTPEQLALLVRAFADDRLAAVVLAALMQAEKDRPGSSREEPGQRFKV